MAPPKKKVKFMLTEKELLQYKINKKKLRLYEAARKFESLLLFLYGQTLNKNNINSSAFIREQKQS